MAVTAERVNVTDVATALNPADSDSVSGTSVLLTNSDGTNAIDLGPSDVTSGGGYQLAAGDSVSVDLSSGETLYGIAAATVTVVVHVLRVG